MADEEAAAGGTGERRTCTRCEEPIVPDPNVLGLWLAADRAAPRIGEHGQRRGLCPDGQDHQPREADQR
jgi:hypothetical protein